MPVPAASCTVVMVPRVCGIAGKVTNTSRVDRELVERMCAPLHHRGPDSTGIFVDEGVGLGIQRLAVIDLQTGDQPIFNEDRSLVVILNGEIYNYLELREELIRRGHTLATHGDTEVIVHLYEEYGDRCVDHLRGMFAFALWDTRQKRLLIGRDRVGKKPLFYAHTQDGFWFGSEAKALLADPMVSRVPNYRAIDRFLHYGFVPASESAFAGILRLPPGHTLVLLDGRVTLERYWKLSYKPGDLSGATDGEVEERIRQTLITATRLRMRSDVPLGAFLSGGVDSSAVVAAMARAGATSIETFSIGFDVAGFDETEHARAVARRYATNHHEHRVHASALEVLPRLVWHYGEPFADASAIPSFYLAEYARERVTVALNGDGGDESFAGYPRYVAASLAARMDGLPQRPFHAARLVLDHLPERVRGTRPLSRLQRLLLGLEQEPAERYASWVAYLPPEDRQALYEPAFASAVSESRWASVVTGPYTHSDGKGPLDRLLDADVQCYLVDDLLVKMDIATMAHSLEVRSPLLDQEFMALAAALPEHDKLSGRTTKRMLKRALAPWLPEEILSRPKMGFEVPLADWFRGELRELPREVLLDGRSRARGMFRPKGIEKLIDDHVSGLRDNSRKLWALVQLELWFRTWIDMAGETPALALSGRAAA